MEEVSFGWRYSTAHNQPCGILEAEMLCAENFLKGDVSKVVEIESGSPSIPCDITRTLPIRHSRKSYQRK
jgi:hypothetical protein